MASIYLVQLIPLQPLLRNTFNCFSSNYNLVPWVFSFRVFVFSNLYHTIRYELSLYFLKLIFRCANDNHDIIKASKILNQRKISASRSRLSSHFHILNKSLQTRSCLLARLETDSCFGILRDVTKQKTSDMAQFISGGNNKYFQRLFYSFLFFFKGFRHQTLDARYEHRITNIKVPQRKRMLHRNANLVEGACPSF